MQNKTTVRFHLIPVTMAKNSKEIIAHAVRMQSKGNTYSLFMGKKISRAILEISLVVPQEAESRSTLKSSYSVLGYIPKGFYILFRRYLLIHVH